MCEYVTTCAYLYIMCMCMCKLCVSTCMCVSVTVWVCVHMLRSLFSCVYMGIDLRVYLR